MQIQLHILVLLSAFPKCSQWINCWAIAVCYFVIYLVVSRYTALGTTVLPTVAVLTNADTR